MGQTDFDFGEEAGEAAGAEGPGDQAAGTQQDLGKNNFYFNFHSSF
jgi:hypothetical protein